METRRTLLIDAFAAEPLAGNAAGVVPDADGLDAERMGAIARELSASETAFLTPDADAAVDRRIRYFTPEQEVDLCGHATIASLVHLHDEGALDAGEGRLRTNAGVVDVEVTEDGVAWMGTGEPSVEVVDLDYERAGEALGIDPAAMADVGADLPAAVASVGLPFLIVPVNFLERLGGAAPDMDAVEDLAAEYGATGVYAFTFDALEAASTLHARMWAPGAGVPEDPVTGTASGACGAYLHAIDAFDDPPATMRFEQGHFVDRPGLVRVEVDGNEEQRSSENRPEAGDVDVRVGGHAVTALDGSLAVPPADDDDIVEA
jgi:PhzF family phenazine biosynthesis protein